MPAAYRGFSVRKEGSSFIARPDDEAKASIEIVARSEVRAFQRIDELWAALEQEPDQRHRWINKWLAGTSARINPDTELVVESLLDTFDVQIDDTTAGEVPTFTTDTEGVIDSFNEEAEKLWGRRPIIGIDKFTGALRVYDECFNPIPSDETPMAMSVRDRRPIRGFKMIVERPDGSRTLVNSHPTPIRGDGGEITGYINYMTLLREVPGRDGDEHSPCGNGLQTS